MFYAGADWKKNRVNTFHAFLKFRSACLLCCYSDNCCGASRQNEDRKHLDLVFKLLTSQLQCRAEIIFFHNATPRIRAESIDNVNLHCIALKEQKYETMLQDVKHPCGNWKHESRVCALQNDAGMRLLLRAWMLRSCPRWNEKVPIG